MISRATASAALLCAALTAAACGPAFFNRGGDDGARGPADQATTVEVQNYNWSDMRIYLVRGGIRTRLGYVSSMTKAALKVPSAVGALSGDFRLMAAPIGSTERFYSDPVHAAPGSVIEWRLENRLPLSSISIW